MCTGSLGGGRRPASKRASSDPRIQVGADESVPRSDPSKDLIFDFHLDGLASEVPDPWKAWLDAMQLAIESGKRADF